MMKRFLALILAVLMLIGTVPVNVFAAGAEAAHAHMYEPAVTDPTGTETYICTCGATASPYLQQLPENIIGCTNLYEKLAPVKGYYTAVKYDTSNGAVLSVVIPVKPGDRIAASSFGPVSENMGSVNGIRVTYLLGDTIVTSLSAGDVYNGYTSNGYITVPDGVDAVCVPWWKPSDSNWLTLEQISKNFAVHSPKAVPAQAPTCTEKGYTAGEICEVCEASLEGRAEIAPAGHTYSGDTCNACGAVNIEAILGGKYVSILGDSISTFNGYSNDDTVNTTIGGNGPRYDAGAADTKPGSYCLLESVNDTWWMHFAGRSGMNLLVNNSWAGSQVFGGKTSDGRVIPAAYLDRCVNLHDNTLENNPGKEPINPDVIFVYLGINDYNFNRSKVGNGAVDYAGLVDSNGTCVTPATFGEAYGIMLHKMRSAYPDAQIFAMTLLPENLYSIDKTAWEQHNTYIRAAAEYYDIPVVDLAENCAITWENYSRYMIDKIHPTTAGMKLISDCIEKELQAYYKENPPHTHTYKNGTCTGCGEADPNYAQPLPLRYDDHYDITGKTVEILDAGKPTSSEDTTVVSVNGCYLVASGIGTALVRINGQRFCVTVEKAKINLVTIMGQSNAGNHFANATSDVLCPPGTAYWWGNGQGTSALKPVPYTQPSMGFHTPLLAELYAQSAAAGDPVKNVLIWQEGITSKNGQSITKWAASATDTSGTDATVTMIQNCRSYYEYHSDKFEIVHSGVYWLQGESDTAMDPELYTQRYMAMWQRLKNAGVDYVAFLRLRRGVNGNGLDHQDLHHSASLSAQIRMINENPEFYMATDLTENWVGTETDSHTVDISNYITVMETYGAEDIYSDSYGNTATVSGGKLTTTMKTLYGSNNRCHYGKFGYGLIGADAAYNMYHALNTQDTAIVMTDTSGHADRKRILSPEQKIVLDITDMQENLSFRPACGSSAGTLKVTVRSGESDVTNREGLIVSSGQYYGSVSIDALRRLDNASVVMTYATTNGVSHSAYCTITCEKEVSQTDYIWNFDKDLSARSADGEILNAFLTDALTGSYSIENGYLKADGLQLQLEKTISLNAGKSWSVEWKYGAFTNGNAGFLLCEVPGNTIGNRGIYHVKSGQLMISDYPDKKGYRNYTSSDVVIEEYDCLRLSNHYDPETKKNTLSLWKNGKLVIADFQLKGSLDSADDDLDMTAYPLNADFAFRYLGNKGMSNWLVNCELDYLKISFGDEPEWAAHTMSVYYDDHLDMGGKTVEIVDAGKPTSWQVGYGIAENTVADTAVVTLEDQFLVATGIGTATVRIDGTVYEITVEAAPISLLLLIGQSNMQGIDGDPDESIVCPTGQVYATYADRYKKTVEDVTKFAPSALTGTHSTINVTGDTACLENYPVNMLTDAGSGREGMDSGLAYEWTKQTGEKVWTVNVGYGGSSITEWQEGGAHYEACLALFSACQETLRREIDAGHFTLSHMAYFWCQGCADENQTAKWYADRFQTMHKTLKNKMVFPSGEIFEFAGIIPIRSGHNWVSSYRAGIYKDTTTVPYYQSFKDLQFNGPRVAQYWMGNHPELTDIWNVCTIQEGWATLPDGSDGVSEYFQSVYVNGVADYVTQVQQPATWYKPTTPAAVHDNIHYNQIGYNELGRESARNALILLGEVDAPAVTPTVRFLTWDGFTPADNVTASTTGVSGTLVVPMVYPVWKSKDITYTVTEGLRYEYYDLLADSVRTEGTLTAADAAATVTVAPREMASFRWNSDNSGLVSSKEEPYTENTLSKLAGSVSNGIFRGVRYKADQAVQLLHTESWGVEIQIEDWTAASGSMILSSSPSAAVGEPYFYFRPKDFFVGIGSYNGSTYDNYGISLKQHGIACSEGVHTYRFVNRISEDGTNMIYLIVDNQEIGALTDHYVNSALSDRNNHWLNGKDFAMPYFGTTTAPISDCRVNDIAVTETQYDPDIHLHTWSDWKTVTAAGPDGPGKEKRSCPDCGQEETRDVNGVWQSHGLSEHLVTLPDNFCAGTNLWPVLPHDPMYYHSGEKWATHESGSVYSVTLPVTGGDQIFATSFGKYPGNGNTIGTSNGIRVTFFGAEGVLKTLAPQNTYAEFVANGGYLVAPEGTVAANIPLYSNSDANEIYILNRDHTYQSTVTAPTCTEQGYTTYTCACGDSDTGDYVNATGHDWNKGVCATCGDALEGKKVSILSHSASTYAGVSNSTQYNSTIGKNDVYYTEGRHDVYRSDTWWQQTIDALGMRLLVNNSWSGSCVFMPRKGEASIGYGDRAVNLHNDHTGEEPDMIFVYLGCNDFAYYKDTFGKAADVDYSILIQENGNGTFTYATPQTTCEAYAIMLHKAAHRYPDAEIYCMTSTARRETDYTGDSYPDAGQPTLYSAELQKVATYFGFPVIDLEKAIPKDVSLFDKYMGDKRAHPNALGMDQITNAVLSVILNQDAEIRHVTADHGLVEPQAVLLGGSYAAEVAVREGYSLVVSMDGKDVTDDVYRDGKITIAEVTGDIVITEVIDRTPMLFRWKLNGSSLISVGQTENVPKKLAGTIADGILNDGRYELSTSVVLRHDLPWTMEWKCAENWRGVLLSSDPASVKDITFISRVNGGQLCIGTWTGTKYHNYGVDISALDEKAHTYRLENRIAADGSNMVWLYVNDAEMGPMNNYYIGSNSQNTTSDWVSGKDFVLSYVGIENHALRNCRLEYLAVEESAHIHTYQSTVTAPTCTEQGYTTYICACGDSYVAEQVKPAGHSYCLPVFHWSEDYSCSASVSCTVCGESQNLSCNITAETIPATEQAEGRTTYTATVNWNDRIYQDTQVVLIPKKEHTIHTPGKQWYTDDTSHWKECTICEEKTDLSQHIPGPAPTENTSQTCTVCGIVLRPPLGLDWIIDRANDPDTYLWASGTYAKILEQFS